MGVALRGRRNRVRDQGRANAALLLLARDMDAEFVEPARPTDFAVVKGRTRGCTFELQIADAARGSSARLLLSLRHYHTQATGPLDGKSMRTAAVI